MPRPILLPLTSPAAPWEDNAYLGSGLQSPHPPGPATEQHATTPHPPSPARGQRNSGDWTPASGGGGNGPASSSPPSATAPTLPAVPLQRSRPPSLRHALSLLSPDQPIPGLSCSLLRPTAPSPSARQLSPSLKAPPCTSPHPGQDSKASILWGPAGRREERGQEGPQRSVFLVPASPLVRAEDPWALCHSRCYSYRPLPKEGKTHEGNGPQRRGRDAGLRDPGPPRAPSPLCCALPPAGGGKPRSSHIRENRPTKCDQTQ